MLKVNLYLSSFILFFSCSTIDFEDIKGSNNPQVNSTTFNEEIICETDTAIFYSKGKYNITLSTDTIPYINNYRLPTKQEAKLLSNYINEDKRILCVDNDVYYTFSYKSSITKAGYKTTYYYIPIRTYSTKETTNINIDVDIQWKNNTIIDLE